MLQCVGKLNKPTSQEDMEAAGIFDAYEQYAGSYVSPNGWINYVVNPCG